jgi:hypothetical protein
MRVPVFNPRPAYRLVLAAFVVGGSFLALPSGVQAAQQALYQDQNGNYYCFGTCGGGACCDSKILLPD